MPNGLTFKQTDYLELVDMTGRIIRKDKNGVIDPTLQPILQRLGLPPDKWLSLSTQFEQRAKGTVHHELLIQKDLQVAPVLNSFQ